MYTSIYTEEIPVLLDQLANTTEMRSLSDIGMHCGCEYAKIPFYQNAGTPYSRLIHSVGVSLSKLWKGFTEITAVASSAKKPENQLF